MATFKVTVALKGTLVTQFEVEAESKGEARHKALEAARDEPTTWERARGAEVIIHEVEKLPGFEGDF